MKANYLLAVLFLSGVGAFATSKTSNSLIICSIVPTVTGTSIDPECPYHPSLECCYLAKGSSAEYIRQVQGGSVLIIRRSPSHMVTIFGISQ